MGFPVIQIPLLLLESFIHLSGNSTDGKQGQQTGVKMRYFCLRLRSSNIGNNSVEEKEMG